MVTIRDNIGLADAATSTQTGTVGEPSAAASWSGMFITGNWYASRSSDAGRTWTFVDPFTSFPADRGEFCCDQLVLWEPKRKFWVWLLQYSQLGGTNIFRVAVSPDAAPGSWHTWEVTPADVNPTWKSWFDYPDMAVSDDHLYISFNQYSTSDAWLRASVFRYSLDELDGLARGRTGPLTREQWTTTQHGSLRFVVGAGDTMWWASNDIDAGALHVFAWPDASAAVESWVVRVGAWNGDDYTAPGPANAAWLNRCDDRVTGGWRTAGAGGARLGWLWSSGRTANRPMPFIRAVTIDESSLRVVAEPDVWSPTIAWAVPGRGVEPSRPRRSECVLRERHAASDARRRHPRHRRPVVVDEADRGVHAQPTAGQVGRLRHRQAAPAPPDFTRRNGVHHAGRPGPAQRRTARRHLRSLNGTAATVVRYASSPAPRAARRAARPARGRRSWPARRPAR